jgi:hypothetical protein
MVSACTITLKRAEPLLTWTVILTISLPPFFASATPDSACRLRFYRSAL